MREDCVLEATPKTKIQWNPLTDKFEVRRGFELIEEFGKLKEAEQFLKLQGAK